LTAPEIGYYKSNVVELTCFDTKTDNVQQSELAPSYSVHAQTQHRTEDQLTSNKQRTVLYTHDQRDAQASEWAGHKDKLQQRRPFLSLSEAAEAHFVLLVSPLINVL